MDPGVCNRAGCHKGSAGESDRAGRDTSPHRWQSPDSSPGVGAGGRIEAEAAMLGQPVAMLIPDVVGFQLSGSLPEGTTATDLVLTIARSIWNMSL